MAQLDYEYKVIRESEQLTVWYVASWVRGESDNLDLTGKNQVILLVDLSLWNLTSMEMKAEFSHNNIDYYQETSLDVSWGTWIANLFEYTFNEDGKFRIAYPIKDRYMRISVKWTWDSTGSLCKITNITWLA